MKIFGMHVPDFRWTPQGRLNKKLFDAAGNRDYAFALQLLAQGADPMYREQDREMQRPHTALDFASGSRELVSAILARLTQQQMDRLLLLYVSEGNASYVRALLDTGADWAQQNHGRSLIHFAPTGAEDVKRILRSIDTASSINAAMGCDEDPAPQTATKAPFTL